jgi:hypothetical protein
MSSVLRRGFNKQWILGEIDTTTQETVGHVKYISFTIDIRVDLFQPLKFGGDMKSEKTATRETILHILIYFSLNDTRVSIYQTCDFVAGLEININKNERPCELLSSFGVHRKQYDEPSNKQLDQPETKIAYGAMFVDGSGQNEQSLQGSFYTCSLPSYVSFG